MSPLLPDADPCSQLTKIKSFKTQFSFYNGAERVNGEELVTEVDSTLQLGKLSVRVKDDVLQVFYSNKEGRIISYSGMQLSKNFFNRSPIDHSNLRRTNAILPRSDFQSRSGLLGRDGGRRIRRQERRHLVCRTQCSLEACPRSRNGNQSNSVGINSQPFDLCRHFERRTRTLSCEA